VDVRWTTAVEVTDTTAVDVRDTTAVDVTDTTTAVVRETTKVEVDVQSAGGLEVTGGFLMVVGVRMTGPPVDLMGSSGMPV